MKGFCSAGGPDVGGMDENEASFDCDKTLKDPELADWYICGGRPSNYMVGIIVNVQQPTSRANATSLTD